MSTYQAPGRGRSMRRSTAVLVIAAALAGPPSALAAPGSSGGSPGFRTSAPSMLSPAAPGIAASPIITVGDRLPGGYRFEAIPDGIALRARGNGRLDVYVNHETSTVPFPYNAAAPTAENSLNDFENSQVSRLALHQRSGGVLHGSLVIPSGANYQRFCSNFLAGAAEGFDRDVLLTNEEATDVVNRRGTAWPATPEFGSQPQQAGVVVAYDVRNGRYRTILGMGRLNHENSVAIPGYPELAVLTGDDTFSSNPPSSQLYLYTAPDTSALLADRGTLWAFRSDDASVDDYYDLTASGPISGRFIPVPKQIATGDQTALETWSDDNGVFQFIRLEDIAYDRTTPGVVYVADTGRGSGAAPNGRIYRFELSAGDPRVVEELSILIDGDPLGLKDPAAIHQPDNLETTSGSLMIQEDPGSGNQYTADEPGATTARIWRYDLATGAMTVVARVDQSADPAAKLGAWESSGIVDASATYGPGAFLVNVQAHTVFVETAPGPDLVAPPGPDWTYKRESGQMVLLRVPGA